MELQTRCLASPTEKPRWERKASSLSLTDLNLSPLGIKSSSANARSTPATSILGHFPSRAKSTKVPTRPALVACNWGCQSRKSQTRWLRSEQKICRNAGRTSTGYCTLGPTFRAGSHSNKAHQPPSRRPFILAWIRLESSSLGTIGRASEKTLKPMSKDATLLRAGRGYPQCTRASRSYPRRGSQTPWPSKFDR